MKPTLTKAALISAIAGLGIAAVPVSAHHTASMFESVKTIGSRETRLASISWKVPGSTIWAMRSRAGTRKWWPHEGHTRRLFSKLFLKRSSEHPGQRSHRSGSPPGAAERRLNGFRKVGMEPPLGGESYPAPSSAV